MSIFKWHSGIPPLRHDPRFHVELISRTLSDKKKGEDLCIIYYPSQAIRFLPDGMPFPGHREPGLITNNMTNRLLVIHDEGSGFFNLLMYSRG